MLITVNGKTKELQNTLTIGQYLEENSYVPSQIAVELNERILSKAEYSTTVLHENDWKCVLGSGRQRARERLFRSFAFELFRVNE